jgi:hypothetical protein
MGDGKRKETKSEERDTAEEKEVKIDSTSGETSNEKQLQMNVRDSRGKEIEGIRRKRWGMQIRGVYKVEDDTVQCVCVVSTQTYSQSYKIK